MNLRPNTLRFHDAVIKWKHFPRYCPFVRGIHRSPVNSPHKGQWRGALVFLWSAPWISGWVNNLEDADLRRHRAHYDVTLMLGGMLHIDITFARALSQELWFRISIEQSGFIFALIVNNTYYICIIANGSFRCSNETFTLQWCHNEHDGVSNHQRMDCFSTVCSCADQRKHQSSASLSFVRGIHRLPVNCPHKMPVTRKMFPFDDIIMQAKSVWLRQVQFFRCCEYLR